MSDKWSSLMGGSDWPAMVMAGALGGLVRWLTLRQSWREGVVSLIVGAICALYLGPLAVPLLEPIVGVIAPDQGAVGLSSFVVGLGGISLAGLLIDNLPRRKSKQEGD